MTNEVKKRETKTTTYETERDLGYYLAGEKVPSTFILAVEGGDAKLIRSEGYSQTEIYVPLSALIELVGACQRDMALDAAKKDKTPVKFTIDATALEVYTYMEDLRPGDLVRIKQDMSCVSRSDRHGVFLVISVEHFTWSGCEMQYVRGLPRFPWSDVRGGYNDYRGEQSVFERC